MRFSTDPGDILSDHISTTRGLAIKVVGVEGEMLPNHAAQVTQDFVLNNASTFAAHADDFLKVIGLRAKHVDDSDALKQVVSSAAQTAEKPSNWLVSNPPSSRALATLLPIHSGRRTTPRRRCDSATTLARCN